MSDWLRNSHGVIVNGTGWVVAKDDEMGFGNDHADEPWSLWHHGEYVNNYATVEDAKRDAVPQDCSKCGEPNG